LRCSSALMCGEQHFSEVMLGEEFLALTLQQVCCLISSDRLTVSSEEMVFESMIAWIKHDKEARLEHMPKLMEYVRLPLLSRDYLLQEEALIKNNNTCKDFLIEAMKYHLLPADQRHLIKTDRTRPRTPISRVYAVGGFNGSLRVRTVDVYDGLSSVEVYSCKTNEWVFVASMNTRRSSVGVGVVNGKLYAVGGYDGASRQCLSTSVEVYDPTTNTWRQVCDMNMCRRNAGEHTRPQFTQSSVRL
uniref:BACK domain-containing protein n=1 Tax=Denticeps clupeoides TaxID=299321 RepID=A0AAY4E720_9TELE